MIRNPTASGTRIPPVSRNCWSRKHLENLRKGLGATDVVKLANGFVLFSVDGVESAESLIFAYKSFKMAPRFITRVPIRNIRLRVVGTRGAYTYDVSTISSTSFQCCQIHKIQIAK